MAHDHHPDPADLADPGEARVVAAIMQALAAPSRLRILGTLCARPHTVGDLAQAVGMQESAVSHQLRVLRHLRLVVSDREGRRVRYRLHDDHLAALLAQAMSHAEHVGARRALHGAA